jgi:hypothetical protein
LVSEDCEFFFVDAMSSAAINDEASLFIVLDVGEIGGVFDDSFSKAVALLFGISVAISSEFFEELTGGIGIVGRGGRARGKLALGCEVDVGVALLTLFSAFMMLEEIHCLILPNCGQQ